MEITECNALVCHGPGKAPVYETVQIPKLKDNDILIETEASGIGHLDLLNMEGWITNIGGAFPFIPGQEGVGRVVNTGKDAEHLLKKRVITTQFTGKWSEYVVVDADAAIVIDDDVYVESAAFGVGNPYTVMGILATLKEEGKKSIVVSAAASALGKMLNRMAGTYGLHVINVVNREDQKDVLTKSGAKHVIVAQGHWKEEYEKQVKTLEANCLVDSLGCGEVFDALVSGLPEDSFILAIGGLEGKPAADLKSCQSKEVHGKTFKGFNLHSWLKSISKEEREKIDHAHSQRLKHQFLTTVQHKYRFPDIALALEAGAANSTKGKIMLVP